MFQCDGVWISIRLTPIKIFKGGSPHKKPILSLTSVLYGVGTQPHASAALSPGKRLVTHCIGG